MNDIVERLRARAKSLRGMGSIAHVDADTDDEAADEITRLTAEVERLRAGGCARDQSTTQYCAEAARLAEENERLRAALKKRDMELDRVRSAEPDWFWRDLDPDDSGETINEALRHVGEGVVCCINSSYRGPSFFAAVVPVLDAESDDTEEIRADTEAECLLKVRQRMEARAALDGQPAPSPWGPIETAPKTQDESRFGPLIVLTSTHGHRAIGYWGERGGRWGWVNPNDHQIMDYWNAFTHWMPLPPAPKEVE